MKNILISTGGSGGHVILALNIYEHLKNNFEIHIFTDQRGKKFINNKKYNFIELSIPQIPKNLFFKLLILYPILVATIKSYRFIKSKKIKIVFSTGGYMSLPLCISGILAGAKIFLIEPNMVLGRSNKFFLKFCKKILCYSKNIVNFPEKYNTKKFVIEPILSKHTYETKKSSAKNIEEEITILILGGSQGANFFDKLFMNVYEMLKKKYKINIIQQISDKDNLLLLKNFYSKNNIDYELFEFDENIQIKMSKSTIAITRCGASTIHELVHLNLPFIGIPFPFSKDDHQFFNIKFLEKKNCCWLIKQNENVYNEIAKIITDISDNNKNYLKKSNNLNKISYQNTWNNINKKIIDLINEY